MDDEGREILSWIEGETFTDRGQMHPYVGDPPVRVTFTDAQLRAVFDALRTFVSYGLIDVEPAELVRRGRLALAAYGRDFDVPALLAAEYDRVEERCLRHGWHRALAKLSAERAWLKANRQLL